MAKSLLVLGFQRGGTSLLCACLGRHSEINMLYESTGEDVKKGYGKVYNGNKLLLYRQIRYNQRATKFGYAINRLANLHFFGQKQHMVRPYPTSKMSIKDYIDCSATIVYIHRGRTDVVSSMQKRMGMTLTQANNEYVKALYEWKKVVMNSDEEKWFVITYDELVANPEKVLSELCKVLHIPYESTMLQGTEFNEVYPSKTFNK